MTNEGNFEEVAEFKYLGTIIELNLFSKTHIYCDVEITFLFISHTSPTFIYLLASNN